MKDIKFEIQSYLEKHPPAQKIFREIIEIGDIYLIGGILREFRDNGKILQLRDADIVISIHDRWKWNQMLNTFLTEKNRFNGYKFQCEDFFLDVWELGQTWAFREKIIQCMPEDYVKMLPYTVFLNVDAIVYDLKNDCWYDELYENAMRTKIIDIVLEENPFVLLNILRAMILKRRYHMQYSNKIKTLICREFNKNSDIQYDLNELQIKRYGATILSDNCIQEELKQCLDIE